MKPIDNKKKTLCACSIVPDKLKKNKAWVSKEFDRIHRYYSDLEAMCQLRKNGQCEEEGYRGHTKIGVVYHAVCPKCGHTKVSFAEHANYKERRTQISNGYCSRIRPPLLRRPTPESIRSENEELRYGDGYDDVCGDSIYEDEDDNW